MSTSVFFLSDVNDPSPTSCSQQGKLWGSHPNAGKYKYLLWLAQGKGDFEPGVSEDGTISTAEKGATKAFSWVFGPHGRSKWITKEMLSRLSRAGLQEEANHSSRGQMGMRNQNVRKRNITWICESRRCMLFWAVILRGQQRSWYPMATGRTWRCLETGYDPCVTSFWEMLC